MTSNSYPRTPLIDGDEMDVVEHRRVHIYTERAGVSAAVKRRIRRRERRLAAAHIAEWRDAEETA